MWYRYRRGPRLRHVWFLFIPLFFFASHGGGGMSIVFGIATIIILALIGRAIFAAIAGGSMRSGTQNQWYQPSNQQTYQQPYYEPKQNQQQPYQSYQQGYQQPYYQPRSDVNSMGEQQQYQAPQEQQYDSYEQPHAEYQQELPPMK